MRPTSRARSRSPRTRRARRTIERVLQYDVEIAADRTDGDRDGDGQRARLDSGRKQRTEPSCEQTHAEDGQIQIQLAAQRYREHRREEDNDERGGEDEKVFRIVVARTLQRAVSYTHLRAHE